MWETALLAGSLVGMCVSIAGLVRVEIRKDGVLDTLFWLALLIGNCLYVARDLRGL